MDANDLRGMKCPRCGAEGPFDITVTVTVEVLPNYPYPRGIEMVGEPEWTDDSECSCVWCSMRGDDRKLTVRDFKEV